MCIRDRFYVILQNYTCKTINAPKKQKSKTHFSKDNTETFTHLIRHLMEEAPNQDIDDTIIEMEEHYDLNEFNPF